MIGSHFVGKTMLVLFAVPLLAHSGVKLDLKPLEQFVASRHEQMDVDARQIQKAVQSLSASVEMTQSISLPVTGSVSPDPTSKAKLTQVLANLNDLTAQAQIGHN